MKFCDHAAYFVQTIDGEGNVRLCSWKNHCCIGSLLENSLDEIYHSAEANKIREQLAAGDYSDCLYDDCPILANGELDNRLCDIESLEELPKYPPILHLAHEGKCNYNCTICSSYQHMKSEMACEAKWDDKYDIIDNRIREALPYVKEIGAHGTGELFASGRILRLLNEWEPLAPIEECKVVLETNGSLFDEEHWKKIEKLGKYNLSVAITVMSFDEANYQYLSGTKLPISRIEDNLRFVKSLREQGIINRLEIATVMQERNFLEMPSFARRCLDEFGADSVRIRAYIRSYVQDRNIEWFFDVRNKEHPYYALYKKMMEDPIFNDPRVFKWNGGIDSDWGKHPGEKWDYRLRYLRKVNEVITKVSKKILWRIK